MGPVVQVGTTKRGGTGVEVKMRFQSKVECPVGEVDPVPVMDDLLALKGERGAAVVELKKVVGMELERGLVAEV